MKKYSLTDLQPRKYWCLSIYRLHNVSTGLTKRALPTKLGNHLSVQRMTHKACHQYEIAIKSGQ